MSLENEIAVYDNARPDNSGEMGIFDQAIFQTVIRDREIQLILRDLEEQQPKNILELGCGGGWLSKILTEKGYSVIGIDVSQSLVANAKKINLESNAEYITGDCTYLPFKEGSFDYIIGIAILHHLDLANTITECNRVLTSRGSLLFMEPNALNPLMALGRKLFPSYIHTDDEKPIYFRDLPVIFINNGFSVKPPKYVFPYSLCLSYGVAKVKSGVLDYVAQAICPFVRFSEILLEKVPILNRLGGVIVVSATRGKDL
jgi:SAM-dependent methyltransferase